MRAKTITRVRELGFPPNRTLPQIDTSLPLYCLVVSRPQPSDVTQKILGSYLEIRDLIICEQSSKMGTAGVVVWDHKLNSYGCQQLDLRSLFNRTRGTSNSRS